MDETAEMRALAEEAIRAPDVIAYDSRGNPYQAVKFAAVGHAVLIDRRLVDLSKECTAPDPVAFVLEQWRASRKFARAQ